MKSYQEKLDALKAKHDAEIAALSVSEKIRQSLPASEFESHVHVSNLYGKVGTVVYEAKNYPFDAPKITFDVVRELARQLPPVPLTRVKDGSLSFRPTAHVESLPEEKKARWTEEIAVAGLLLHIEPALNYPAYIEWEWVTETPAGLVEINVKQPLHSVRDLVSVKVETKVSHGDKYVSRCDLTYNREKLYTVFGNDGEPMAELAQYVKWSSGGPQYPNKFTLYWIPLTEDALITAEDVLRPFEEK